MDSKKPVIKEVRFADHRIPVEYRRRRRVLKKFSKPSKTDPTLGGELDINNIVAKHVRLTGDRNVHLGPPATLDPRFYGDFTHVESYQDAVFKLHAASEKFSQLPATVRARFENDPSKLIQFMSDSKNFDEAVTLGLVKPKPAEPVVNVSGDEPAVKVDP